MDSGGSGYSASQSTASGARGGNSGAWEVNGGGSKADWTVVAILGATVVAIGLTVFFILRRK